MSSFVCQELTTAKSDKVNQYKKERSFRGNFGNEITWIGESLSCCCVVVVCSSRLPARQPNESPSETVLRVLSGLCPNWQAFTDRRLCILFVSMNNQLLATKQSFLNLDHSVYVYQNAFQTEGGTLVVLWSQSWFEARQLTCNQANNDDIERVVSKT